MVFYNFYKQHRIKSEPGFTLVELLIAIGLTAIVFVGIISGFRLALDISYSVRAEAAATSLANEQIEYIRSLPYEEVGTQAGIPSGEIPQLATTTVNNQTFTIKNLVKYKDDPADGVGDDDENSITTDYKEVKITVSWPTRRGEDSLSLVSIVTPDGIETTGGGGTLRVNVYDANLETLSGADVQIVNNTTASPIDVTQSSNVDGVVEFGGAPEASQYEVFVSRAGYSSAKTYKPSVELPNPNTKPLTVISGEVSTVSFQIDQLGSLTWNFFTAALPDVFTDGFADASSVSASSSVQISNAVFLDQDVDGYLGSGYVESSILSPGAVTSWETAEVVASTTENTTIRYQVTYKNSEGNTALVPNADLAHNETGFLPGTISLRELSVAEYPEIGLRANLETNTNQETPTLQQWSISYYQTRTPETSLPVRVYGTKSIGTDNEESKVYKYDQNHTTNSVGKFSLPDIEWDTYRIDLPDGKVVARACPNIPYSLLPGTSEEIFVSVQAAPTHSLRLRVENTSGEAVPGALVHLESASLGVSKLQTSGGCGQVFFAEDLGQATDYTVTVSVPGYEDVTAYNIAVDGNSYEVIHLGP